MQPITKIVNIINIANANTLALWSGRQGRVYASQRSYYSSYDKNFYCFKILKHVKVDWIKSIQNDKSGH